MCTKGEWVECVCVKVCEREEGAGGIGRVSSYHLHGADAVADIGEVV